MKDFKSKGNNDTVDGLEISSKSEAIKVNFCSNCGAKRSQRGRFCSECGELLLENMKQKAENNDSRESLSKELDEKKAKPKDREWYQTGWVWFWLVCFFPVGVYGFIKRAAPEDQKKWWGSLVALVLMVEMFNGGRNVQSSSVVNIAPFTEMQVCKAVIASAVGRPVNIMSASLRGGIFNISYRRPDDNKTWKYRCKLEGNKGIWASPTGRWRTHPRDSKLTFNVSNNVLYVKEIYGDGSMREKKFWPNSF